jgi:hypothetical protein
MKLSYAARKRLRSSSFAEPRKRKYPIEDIAHGRDALSRVSANGTAREKKIVRRAVYRKYPSLRRVKA